jgi:succinate dehydrogenase / fumarate reductase cytochrome b subunit
MTKVETSSAEDPRAALPSRRPTPFLVRFWGSAVVKKWAMALSGIGLLGFVVFHLVGNLKVFLGKEHINTYGEWLRTLGEPAFPRTWVLWALRVGLMAAFAIHILAAYQLTRINHRARPIKYQAPRDYASANFASRTMRWTGIIVALFVIFHLMDLTWGSANPHFVRGDPYDNLFASFDRVPVAIAYIVAMFALSFHIFHGAWAMFRSLGVTNPRVIPWTRAFATGLAVLVLVGNVSIPLLITTGAVTK